MSVMCSDPKWQHPDLAVERSSPAFDIEEMTNFVDGGQDKTDMKRKTCKASININVLAYCVSLLLRAMSTNLGGTVFATLVD